VRSARNWGVGDFTDLRGVVDAMAPAGAEFLALNPLHAIANRQPYNTSPYLPQCSLYRNYLYLDVERVPGFLPEHAPVEEIEMLRVAELVEYERVAGIKLRALRPAFQRFQQSGQTAPFDEFERAEESDCILIRQMRHDIDDMRRWQAIVRQLENLVLPHLPRGKPEMLFTKLAQELHDRSQGYIGDVTELVTEATVEAIHDGSFTIQRKHLDRVELSKRAEDEYRDRKCPPKRAS